MAAFLLSSCKNRVVDC